MELVYVDSNVFFYAKISDTEYGEACAKIIGDIADANLRTATSTLAVLEVANALKKYGLSDEVKDEIDAIYSLGMTLGPVDDTIVRLVGEIHRSAKISPYDCAHVATMKRLGITKILSADKNFDGIPGVQRIDPKTYAAKTQ